MTLVRPSESRPFISCLSASRFSAIVLLAPVFVTSAAFAQKNAPDPALPPLPGGAASDPTPGSRPDGAPAPSATPGPSETHAPPDVPPAPVPAVERAPECVRRAHVHHGFYLSVGSGFGYVGVRGDGPYGSAGLSGLGSTASLAIGGSIAPGLALAGVIQGGTLTNTTFDGGPAVTVTSPGLASTPPPANSRLTGHATASTFLVGAQVDWFPAPQGGWHVGASLGLGGAAVTDDAAEAMSGAAVAASLFGGHQWELGSDWSLGVSGFILGGSNIKMIDKDRNDTGYRLTPVAVGIQSTLLYY